MTSHDRRLKRREFLQKSIGSAALAGFAIVPQHVLWGAGQTLPSEISHGARRTEPRASSPWKAGSLGAWFVAWVSPRVGQFIPRRLQ